MIHRRRPTDASRRLFLTHSMASAAALCGGTHALAGVSKSRPKVAAVVTEFSHRSHAHVILENFLEPYLFNGEVVEPEFEIASMYIDQFPKTDMGREVAKEYKIPIYPTIGQALTLGKDKLAVDAVLSIGEHGSYPMTPLGQQMYPRKRFFDEIVAVFEQSRAVAPVFNDKHLSYRWDWAKEMFETSRRLKFPLMAGSSVPLAQRRPPIEVPIGSEILEAVSVHGGGVESYDFHGLELLQSFVESRRGGESGVRRVQFVQGDSLWKTAEEGRWSPQLALAAMNAELKSNFKDLKELLADQRVGSSPPHAILIDYIDGKKFAMLKIGASATRWNFACTLKGQTQPLATALYVGPWDNRNLFKALSHAIQSFFKTGKAPYPVERTVLTTGILAFAMQSRFDGDAPLETPALAIPYAPIDFRAMREMGKSWTIITEGTPQPQGMHSARAR
jgi:hypothetical protein